MPWYLFTRHSYNAKTGPIPVTTSGQDSCPDSCTLKNSACYARFGPLRLLWNAVTEGKHAKQISWVDLLDKIKQLPGNTKWRHNQAGDLEHTDGKIDKIKLEELTKANEGKRGYTYTHHRLDEYNLPLLQAANKKGFVINVSLDSINQVDDNMWTGLPLTTVVPADAPKVLTTTQGTRVITCPATWRDDYTCADCNLCMRISRDFAVGFPVHGRGAKSWSPKEKDHPNSVLQKN